MRSLLLGAAMLAASSVSATTVLEMSAEALALRADLVVQVRVEAQEARWLGSRIVTFHRLRVVEVLRGELAPGELRAGELVVGTLGGVIGGRGQSVAGTPSLKAGERWILYLGEAEGPGGARGIVGLFQGAFRLSRTDAVTPGSRHPGVVEVPGDLNRLREQVRAVRP